MSSKHFLDLLEECKEVHRKKNADYATDDNPFSNFERASTIVSWFTNPIDQTFAGIIGIKLARIAELCNGKTAKNESLDDSMLDLTNYTGLWCAYKRSLLLPPIFIEKEKIETIGEKGVLLYKDILPQLCELCNIGDIRSKADHAVRIHKAKYEPLQNTLTFNINGERIICVL